MNASTNVQGQFFSGVESFPFEIEYNSNLVTYDSINGCQIKGDFLFCGRITENLQLSDCEIIRFRLQANDTLIDYNISDYRKKIIIPERYNDIIYSYIDSVLNKSKINIIPNSHFIPLCRICLFEH